MGNILLSRILKYLNGALVYNDYYKFCNYFVEKYYQMKDYNLDDLVKYSGISQESILAFLKYLGFNNYDQFKEKLILDDMMRLDQIKARMLFIQKDRLLDMSRGNQEREVFLNQVREICHNIKKANRIIINGALYPSSIAVELQTDLIMFGKNVLQFHSFDPNIKVKEGDYFIMISGTGRAINEFITNRNNPDISQAKGILITQNPSIISHRNLKLKSCIVGSRMNEFDFNYELMAVLDLIRVIYYKEFNTQVV